MTSVFRSKWGIRVVLFGFLVLAWFGLQAYRRVAYREQFISRPTPSASPARSLEETRAIWRQEAKRIVRMYDEEKEPTKARDALLGLTVTREDQEAHLRLVLALNALAEKNANADVKWQEAKKGFETR